MLHICFFVPFGKQVILFPKATKKLQNITETKRNTVFKNIKKGLPPPPSCEDFQEKLQNTTASTISLITPTAR